MLPRSIPDGSGGMFLAWEDYRSGSADVYAQHLDASGNPLWAANGVPVVTETGAQESPVLTRDGSGGLIVAWQDSRAGAYDIYAQALTSAGATRWTAGGVPICTATGNQVLQVAADDLAGGAYIAWRDLRGADSDIYVQRVSNSGTILFAANGNAVCDTTGAQSDVRILNDQQGGAFLVWRDRRSAASAYDLYAQRVGPTGDMLWVKNGVPIVTADADQLGPSLVSDGRFGFIVAWYDQRGVSFDIYAQRVRQNGSPIWATNGVAVCTADSSQQTPVIVSDGLAGVILAWTDARFSISFPNIYAQRVDSLGVAKWTANGVAVCSADSAQFARTIVADNSGGAIIGWDDARAGFRQVYAQRLTSSGASLWAANGLLIATAAGQRNLRTAVEDGMGGCIFAWEDFRNAPTTDIYAYRVTSIGTAVEGWTAPAAPIRLYPARPNPFNPHTVISFRLDQAGPVRLALFDVQGRLVRELLRGQRPAGLNDVAWDGTDSRGAPCASGVYFALLQAGSTRRQTSITLLR
ncbi:MAG TPA: FlgD immunoglobulin-like domain containing protein [Candidatus Eisenbacteria bacterium]|nr:FlgD immunoglobulin-like domain containing protein [Candidatus Eisenbacteria bacterium]